MTQLDLIEISNVSGANGYLPPPQDFSAILSALQAAYLASIWASDAQQAN